MKINSGGNGNGVPEPEKTGRSIVVLAANGKRLNYSRILRDVAGFSNIASSSDFEGNALDVEQTQDSDVTLFTELGVAVVDADPQQRVALSAAAADEAVPVLSVEPEYVNHALETLLSPDYARGYRDGVSDLSGRISGNGSVAELGQAFTQFADDGVSTWGLAATRVNTSTRSGRGVKVAVLDTGFDLSHPDFTGRSITTQSFVAGEHVQDRNGHGTHCIGTACGPQIPFGHTRRYGCAHDAQIFAGKVLSDKGSGVDEWILAGINWAVANGCHVISMSLGADVATVSQAYETVGRRALNAGSLIVAAAGNSAKRPEQPSFVGRPANSPSIMAVAALDSALAIARFSARSNPVDGGQIDIAGPGVKVFSSWPMEKRYETISGTSMATPHVAGIAALLAEALDIRGRDLWTALTQTALRLQVPSIDVGAGLVQAPS